MNKEKEKTNNDGDQDTSDKNNMPTKNVKPASGKELLQKKLKQEDEEDAEKGRENERG